MFSLTVCKPGGKGKKAQTAMSFALCDDNPASLELLHRLLLDTCARKDWACKTALYTDANAFLRENLSDVQVVFLDIDMPEISGLEAARQLRAKNPDILVVFVTGFIEYAPAGYDVEAFRYLLKSNLEKSLPQCLDAVWEKLYVSQESIRVQHLDRLTRVQLKDILYFEGTPHRHVLLHTLSSPEAQECMGKLSAYESELAGNGFLRIQKSFLVNMRHISEIRNYMAILDNGESLKVSTVNYAKVREQYLLWEGQRL